ARESQDGDVPPVESQEGDSAPVESQDGDRPAVESQEGDIPPTPTATTRALEVLRVGPLALVQDGGRPGHAAVGVPRSGAADRAALGLANRLVANDDESAAGIEVLLGGLTVRAHGLRTVALAGAPAPATV